MKDKNPQPVSAADIRQLANLERATMKEAIRLTDIVRVRPNDPGTRGGWKGIVIERTLSGLLFVMFKDGVKLPYLDSDLIRVAASLGE